METGTLKLVSFPQDIEMYDGKPFGIKTDWFFSELQQKKWESHSFEILDKFLKPFSCFVDIGAWCGVLSLYAMKRCSKILCFEPDPKARDLLIVNLDHASDSKSLILISSLAISDKNGTDTIGHSEGLGQSVSQLGSGSNAVKTGTLSHIFDNQPYHGFLSSVDFIKVDIEGAEVKIFANGELAYFLQMIREAKIANTDETSGKNQDLFSSFRPHIYLSFHLPFYKNAIQDLDYLFETLDGAGYNSFYDPLSKQVLSLIKAKNAIIQRKFTEMVCLGFI